MCLFNLKIVLPDMTKLSKILEISIRWLIYATFVLVPIFFLSVTSEVLDFNKQFLFYLLVTLGILAWFCRAIADKKMELRTTAIDIPLGLFWLFSLISSMVSKDRVLSFWGDWSALSWGFVPLTFYILFYFLVINNIKEFKQLKASAMALGISAVLSVLYFLNWRFDVISLKGAVVPMWNVASGLSSLYGIFLVLILSLVVAILLEKKKNVWGMANILWILAGLSCLTVIAMIGFKSVWALLAVSMFLLLVFAISRLEEIRTGWVTVAFVILVVSLLFTFLGTPKFLVAPLPLEVSLSPGVSWDITMSNLTSGFKTFLFGSGPATFLYDFSASRPESFNQNFAWSTRFLRSYDSALDILSGHGLLGLIFLIAVILAVLGTLFFMWLGRPQKKFWERFISAGEKEVVPGQDVGGDEAKIFTLFIGFAGIWLVSLISFFVISFSTVHWFIFFASLALAISAGLLFSKVGVREYTLSLKTSPQYTLVSSFAFVLVITAIVVLGTYLGRFYLGETTFTKGLQLAAKAETLDQSIQQLGAAIELNPNRAQYHLTLAQAYIARGNVELGKAQPNVNLITSLLASAVNEARSATDLAPGNVANWDFLATMYFNARSLSPNANVFAIAALEKAVALEKTNPTLRLSLGNAKLVAKDLKAAREQFEEAARLKPDYVLAYVDLAVLDEAEGKLNQAIEHMAVAAQLSQNDPTPIFQLGRLYYNRGKSDDLARAEQLFAISIQMNPNYSDALWSLGLLYERWGRNTDALNLYRRVQTLNPGNTDVAKKVRNLGGAVAPPAPAPEPAP